MKIKPELLDRLQEAIAESEAMIAQAEAAMRAGLGPFDIEEHRVKLALLRRVAYGEPRA